MFGARYRFSHEGVDPVQYLAILDAFGEKFPGFAIFTGTFDQVTDFKIEPVSKIGFLGVVFHEIHSCR